MADEAQVRASLQITKGNLEYQSKPTAFNVDVTGTKGPTPGAINVTLVGVDIDLSELTSPGLCRIMNLEADGGNFFEWGVYDGVTFYPIGRVGPGETYVIKLTPNITEEYGTGTGTTGEAVNTFRLKADTAAVEALVEVFEA